MSTVANIFRIPELRRRILFTLGMLAIYRIGIFVTTPGVDRMAMRKYVAGQSGGFLSLFNLFSGGALEQASIFALNIMPYVSASIILSLMTVVVPSLMELRKEGEERRWLDVSGRQAHQAGYRNVGLANLGEEIGELLDRTPALLLFIADIDLHEARHALAHLVHRLGERLQKARPIKRMDTVKQRHRVFGLVRLQLTDEVQLGIRILLKQRGPFALRFLHAVFAEDTVADLKQRRDLLRRVRLAHCNQRDLFAFAARGLEHFGDVLFDRRETSGCTFHGRAL